ncbi:hypothetical protein [Sphingomonas sp.]|uniref:hypothetical protein n=1 Tax=Sphingomonas sp. TaxID=28214 RepID=UPI003B3A93F1
MTHGQFDDFDTTAAINGGSYRVRVTGYVLRGLWGAGVGPQDARGLVERNRAVIETIAAEKLAQGRVEGDLIVIKDVDLDF